MDLPRKFVELLTDVHFFFQRSSLVDFVIRRDMWKMNVCEVALRDGGTAVQTFVLFYALINW